MEAAPGNALVAAVISVARSDNRYRKYLQLIPKIRCKSFCQSVKGGASISNFVVRKTQALIEEVNEPLGRDELRLFVTRIHTQCFFRFDHFTNDKLHFLIPRNNNFQTIFKLIVIVNSNEIIFLRNLNFLGV